MSAPYGLTARSGAFQSTFPGRFRSLEVQVNEPDRCTKRAKGYMSTCSKPAKAYFASVYDPSVIFQVCGVHRKIFTKYIERGSFVEVKT